QSIKKTTQTIISLRSEVASPEFKESLDVDEDIGVDEASSAIDSVFVIGESDVDSMEVPSKFGEFLKNKESVEKVVVGGGEARGVDEYDSNRVILVLKEGGEARFEAIANKDNETAGKVQSIKKTTQTLISLRSEVASPEFKGSLDVDEDIGVDEPSSEIDSVFVIGKSDVESMEVPRKFGEFLKNKESIKSEHDAKDALSKLLQMGLVAEYQKACFEAIPNKDKETAGKEQSIKKTTQTIISLRSKVASPVFKGSLDVDEDIGVDEVSSAIDNVFVIGESDVESMEVPSKVGKFLKNKESVEEVVVVGGEARGVDEYDSNRVILNGHNGYVFVYFKRDAVSDYGRKVNSFPRCTHIVITKDMLADENVSQAVIKLDVATKHAEEISKEISPQVDGQKYAHRVTFFVG
nr:hypothetical protein [Tanacetum cinerariifolium]